MKIGCWTKLVLILTSVVAVLQVIHLILLNRLEYLHQHRPRLHVTQKEPLLSVEDEARELFKTLEESLRNDHILDSTGVYRIATNIPKGSKQPSYSLLAPDLTLVTQCSYNHLNKLIDLVKRWQVCVILR
ncbi:hypothetical protein AAG570_008595 [Ranatra chinensis]|uniref:Beta-1,4-glucuronyltransferase 1 n=1 Tax=Ranatra chinensis TaxID=642074 RepID=A0ABD0Z491_9HEMI